MCYLESLTGNSRNRWPLSTSCGCPCELGLDGRAHVDIPALTFGGWYLRGRTSLKSRQYNRDSYPLAPATLPGGAPRNRWRLVACCRRNPATGISARSEWMALGSRARGVVE